MNTSEAAKQEIICLDTTPCLFGGVSSFREHLTILSLVVLQFLLEVAVRAGSDDAGEQPGATRTMAPAASGARLQVSGRRDRFRRLLGSRWIMQRWGSAVHGVAWQLGDGRQEGECRSAAAG